MQVIRRMSEFFTEISEKNYPHLKKKPSSFIPVTRLEKIRQKDYIYPQSTNRRFIFIANLDGSGFQRQNYPECPKQIHLQQMINQLNTSCHKQWQINRDYYTKHPFQKMNLISNISIYVTLLLLSILFLGGPGKYDAELGGIIFFFLAIICVALIISIVTYSYKFPYFDTDQEMIKCINKKLDYYNERQKKKNRNNPEFIWTTHKECLWIALRLLRQSSKIIQTNY